MREFDSDEGFDKCDIGEPEQTFMSDSDIIEALRAGDQEQRQQALDAIYGPVNAGAVLFRLTPTDTDVGSSTMIDVHRAFTALVATAQTLGNSVGLQLHWVQAQPMPDPKSLVVPPPGSFGS